jgi:apolipoprotein N-acyltransferase
LFFAGGLGKLGAVHTSVASLSERSRLGLAVAGGLMLAAAFPKIGMAGLAWLGPGAILFAARGAKSPFVTGYVGGLAFTLGALHWLLFIPVRFYPVLGWLALCAYIGLYPAVWCWLCLRLEGNPGHAGDTPPPWSWRVGWALSCAAIWVALEMIQARLFSGFPWNLLGVSQYRMLPLIQLSSVAGVYGVSFLVTWGSVCLALTATRLLREPSKRFAWLADMALPLAVVTVLCAVGLARIASMPRPTRQLRVALVQPSIPQSMIWDEAESGARFQQVLDLSKLALATKPDLLVWPEAATPKLIRYDRDIYEAVTNLAGAHRVWLVLGADDADPRGPTQAVYFNSSFLVSPQGRIEASYRKRQLVIFGEYIPLVRWLPFMKWLTPIGGGFEAGDRVVPFDLRAPDARAATLICFEDVFPHLVREYATPETDFLLNLTNDGWFGKSAAHWQQAACAVFRAVENGLPLVRCANNGLTCWIDAAGAMHEVYFGDSKDIYGAGFKTAQIPLRPDSGPRPATFYNRHGDWLGWGCLALCGILFFPRLARQGSEPARRS